jgi:ubiquitin C-terminal hydrolase
MSDAAAAAAAAAAVCEKIESPIDESIKHIQIYTEHLSSMEELEPVFNLSKEEFIENLSKSPDSQELFSNPGSPIVAADFLDISDGFIESAEIKIEDPPVDIEKSYEEMRRRYDFRQTPGRMSAGANSHPPEISGDDLKGVCGIANMGNTCYANSCLQILRAAGDWSHYLISTDLIGDSTPLPDKASKESKVLIGYQDILRTLWSASSPAYIRPMGWLGVVREAVQDSVYEMFAHPIPNDSHEYLVWLLDNFHEAMLVKSKGRHAARAAQAAPGADPWQQFLATNNTQMADRFFGLIHKEIRCHGCNNRSISYEPFNVLKIPCLDPAQPFEKWFENYFVDEEFDDYACDSCKPTRTKATITQSIWRAPRNLFVSVRRFSLDGRKNNMPVPADGTKEINIVNSYNPLIVKKGPVNTKYCLRGVVDHHGSHMGGHYTAQFFHPVSKHWWWIDDESTQYMPEPRFGSSNYIFLYRNV